MELKVYWTAFAENKLKNIFEYYSSKVNINVALKISNGIIENSIKLQKNPEIGQIEELLLDKKQQFRYLIYTNYKIIYWINYEKNRIDISTVFDIRQNPKKINKLK